MAQLVLVLGDDRYVSFTVEATAVIGRASECDIQVVDASVSRRHAQLSRQGDAWVVEDLGSTTGIRVDGERAAVPRPLRRGSTLEVGALLFVFEPPFSAVSDRAGERSLVLVDGDDAPALAALEAPPPIAQHISLASHQLALELVASAERAGSPQAALHALVESLGPRIGAERVLVIEQLADGRLRPLVIHGKDKGVAVSRTVIARALAASAPFAVADAIADVAFARATSVFALGVRAVIAAPIRRGDAVIGALVADHRQRGAFVPDALGELAAAALTVGALLRRARPIAAAAPAWIGSDPATRDVLAAADRAAASTARVLITGESGTGKELVARRIHAGSARAAGPLVALNCAALGEGVLDSELFGHEKGAFTGAVRRKAGCFEQADGGTLFLDEVGELTPSTQAKLLRAIQEGRFVRVGGEQPIDVDVRIVAATNRDLRAQVQAGAFREDLYYRLAVIPLALPPLRARGEDLVALTGHFMAQLAAERGRPAPVLGAAAWARWRAYAWPGNVRELRNVVERLVVLSDGGEIEVDQLPAELQGSGAPAPVGTLGAAIGALERELIGAALERHAGNKSQTARALGISRPTLDKKLKDYGLGEP